MQPQQKRKAQGQPQQKAPKRQRVSKDRALPRGAMGSAPVAYGVVRPDVKFRSASPSRRGSEMRVIGCDYLGSVSTSATTAQDNTYQVAPYELSTFPRLTDIAAVFGKYAFNRLRFYVVGKAASTLAGDMTSAFAYDGLDGGTALTESQIKNRSGQVTSKFWENHVMEIDCSRATVPWFISPQVESGSTDTNTFGWYHIFTEATSSGAAAVADVFVEYDVEFCEAKASSDPA